MGSPTEGQVEQMVKEMLLSDVRPDPSDAQSAGLPMAPEWCVPAPGNYLVAIHDETGVVVRVDPHDDDEYFYLTVLHEIEDGQATAAYSTRAFTGYGVRKALPVYLRELIASDVFEEGEWTIDEGPGVRDSGYHWLTPDSELDWHPDPASSRRSHPCEEVPT
jgi:hypothetical protein